MAIASLILGIVSVMGAAVLILPTILAIVLGHVAHNRIRKNPSLDGRGLAVTGFVLGYASIVFGIIFGGLVAAMAIPAFQKVRQRSMEMALLNDGRQIAAAAQQEILEKGNNRIVFSIDAAGALSGSLSTHVPKVTPGTQQVDGVIENAEDTFSLRNPHAFHGDPVVFNLDGSRK